MTENEKTESNNKDIASIYKFVIIENIVTIILMCSLFAYTNSAWCFLLLLNLSTIKSKK